MANYLYFIRKILNILPDKVKDYIKITMAICFRKQKYKSVFPDDKILLQKYTVLSNGSAPTFFGYHDKTPFSEDGKKILAMSITADDRKFLNECTPMDIGFFQKQSNEKFGNRFFPFSKTMTWCWQQGCMLQWFPNHSNTKVIYNTLVDNSYGSEIFDLESNSVTLQYHYPIYSIDPKGKTALSLNFSRLDRLRPGYGYKLFPDPTENIEAPNDDGLFVIDMQTGKHEIIINLNQLRSEANRNSCQNLKDVQHYINHATYSPDGKKILFFHLWAKKNRKGQGMQICIMEVFSGKWFVLESERRVSHYCWKNNYNVLATTQNEKGQWNYTLYDLNTKKNQDLGIEFVKDGHPMFHPTNKHLFITDTYPDKLSDQYLYCVDINSKHIEKMASLYSHFRYQRQVRCDLHPRWDREGNYVIVDSTVFGKRKMILFKSGI
ncbi:TolB family protein [Desulfobacter latus]|uniref:Oligogalacturonate lyase domain-containing protein n=1 Tax=Desulfobacter latus TaxID=2292 RepID=A0A850T969_9BACT|nr:hypothetical protein [Desulfobacter latus]NWH05785.1 hypothetical protein [Desulfobacter latus]